MAPNSWQGKASACHRHTALHITMQVRWCKLFWQSLSTTRKAVVVIFYMLPSIRPSVNSPIFQEIFPLDEWSSQPQCTILLPNESTESHPLSNFINLLVTICEGRGDLSSFIKVQNRSKFLHMQGRVPNFLSIEWVWVPEISFERVQVEYSSFRVAKSRNVKRNHVDT